MHEELQEMSQEETHLEIPESPPAKPFFANKRTRMTLQESGLRAELASNELKRKRMCESYIELESTYNDLLNDHEGLSHDNLVLKYEIIKLQNMTRKARMMCNSTDGTAVKLSKVLALLRNIDLD